MRLASLAVALFALLAAGPAAAAPPAAVDVKALVDRMQAFYEKTSDFTADFRQEYTYQTLKRVQVSTGKVTYRKPAMMRWEYLAPAPRTFVLARDRAYLFDPEAKLLTRSALQTNQLSASVTFLWGQGKLAQEFSIAQVPCPGCEVLSATHPKGGVLLELTPLKPDPRFKLVRLEVEPGTAQVLRSIVVDPDGSQNAISFLDLKANVGVREETFVIAAPPGTQTQDYLGAAAAAGRGDGVDGADGGR
jgi:outer membrane lipoprotein carrier protein